MKSTLHATTYLRTTTYVFTLLGLCLAQISSVFAQSEQLLMPLQMTTNQLSTAQKSMVQKMESNAYNQQIQYVRMGNPARLQKAGQMIFSLPGSAKQWIAQTDYVEAYSEQDYTYSAHLADSSGFVLLTASQGKVRGHFSLDGEVYEVHPIENGVHALVRFNMSKISPSACTLNGKQPLETLPKLTPTASSARLGTCNTTNNSIRVLTLFTPGARQQDANVVQTVNLALAQVNTAFRNSGVSSFVNVTNAGILEYNFTETGNILNDRNAFVADPLVNNLRLQREADLVMLVTRDAYGAAWGVAFTDFTLASTNAYAISNVGTATTQYTYAHELGHLLGCRHQQCSVWDPGFGTDSGCENGSGINHGYSYLGRGDFLNTAPKPRQTIMHQAGRRHASITSFTPYVYILNYSNPNVEVERRATGRAGLNDNASYISSTYSTIANYVPFSGTLSASISGPSSLNPSLSYSWEVNYSCGRAPYTFAWAISTNGFNYGSTAGTGEIFNSGAGFLFSSSSATIRCIVTSADGQTTTAFISVSRSSSFRLSANEKDSPLQTVEIQTEGTQDEGITLYEAYPNPANTQTTISFLLPQPVQTLLEVTDYLGRPVVRLVDGMQPAGYHNSMFDRRSLPAGVYFYRLTTPQTTQTKRLVIIE